MSNPGLPIEAQTVRPRTLAPDGRSRWGGLFYDAPELALCALKRGKLLRVRFDPSRGDQTVVCLPFRYARLGESNLLAPSPASPHQRQGQQYGKEGQPHDEAEE